MLYNDSDCHLDHLFGLEFSVLKVIIIHHWFSTGE